MELSVVPLSLSVLATVVAASVWLFMPRLQILVHREHPSPGFLLYEVCLTLGANRLAAPGRLQLSFYLSLKKS
ncbi:MAG TPA: hypothetical protein VK438_07025 [Xanthobacteraceae bacterium]|nr:hypothetical protein [Xanthobacteraceae bacterium]